MTEGNDPSAPRRHLGSSWADMLKREEEYLERRRQDLDRVERRKTELAAERAEQELKLGEARQSGIDADVASWEGRIRTTDGLMMANELHITEYRGYIQASLQRVDLYRGYTIGDTSGQIEPGSRQEGLPRYPEAPRPGNIPRSPYGYGPRREGQKGPDDPDWESPQDAARRRSQEQFKNRINEDQQGQRPYEESVWDRIRNMFRFRKG